MKRKLAFIVCLLAVLLWTMHAFVPHHHVDAGSARFIEEICWNNHFHKKHQHNDERAHHEHESLPCVFLQMLPLAPEKCQLQEQELFHLDQSLFLAIIFETSLLPIDGISFQYILFNVSPDFQTFISGGVGLRAPPII